MNVFLNADKSFIKSYFFSSDFIGQLEKIGKFNRRVLFGERGDINILFFYTDNIIIIESESVGNNSFVNALIGFQIRVSNDVFLKYFPQGNELIIRNGSYTLNFKR
jgi:hypothetical protein